MIQSAVVALGLLLALGGRAVAKDEGANSITTVGILRVDTSGVSDTAAILLENEVEDALGSVGLEVIGRRHLGEILASSDFIDGCTFGPCLSAVREAADVPLVLVARIHGVGSSYSVVITLIDTKSGVSTSQVAQTCAVCTVEEAISTATLATVALVTGTGDAEVTDPGTGPVGAVDLSNVTDGRKNKSSSRRLATYLLIGSAAAGLSGLVFLATEAPKPALFSFGASAGLLAGGGTMLLLSRRF